MLPAPIKTGPQPHDDTLLERNTNGQFPVITRKQTHAEGHWHRAVGVWLYTSDGKVLVQKRSMLKDTQPGKWQLSCAGHVTSGDSVMETVITEIEEELGITSIKPSDLEFIAVFAESLKGSTDRFGPYVNNEYKFLFIARIDEQEIIVEPAEVEAVAFMDVHEVFSKLRARDDEFCLVANSNIEAAYAAITRRLYYTFPQPLIVHPVKYSFAPETIV